jgi:hypothetical protein
MRTRGEAAPGSITLEDSEYLDENATDTDAIVTNVTVPSGSYNALLVIVMFNPEGTPQRTVSSVYWDTAGANEAFTAVNAGNYVTGDDAHAEAFYLAGPTAGDNKSVTVNFSADLTYGSAVAVYSLSGAAQSGTVRNYCGDAQQAGSVPAGVLSCTISSIVANDFIGMGSYHEDSTSAAIWSGSGFSTTTLFDEADTQGSYSSAYGTADSASELCEVDWDVANHTAIVSVAIKVAD